MGLTPDRHLTILTAPTNRTTPLRALNCPPTSTVDATPQPRRFTIASPIRPGSYSWSERGDRDDDDPVGAPVGEPATGDDDKRQRVAVARGVDLCREVNK